MPTGQTLASVRNLIKAECGKSLDTTATAQDAKINQIIANEQSWLASKFDWPQLDNQWDKAVVVSDRYVTFPTVDVKGNTNIINLDRPITMYVNWNNIFRPSEYGIDVTNYNAVNPDLNQLLSPVQRWQMQSSTTVFEIWPKSAGPQTMRFRGQQRLTSLQTGSTNPPTWNDSATLDLDDLMIGYFASAKLLSNEKQADAPLMLQKATDRMNMLRGAYPKNEMPVVFGRPSEYNINNRGLKQVSLVIVAGS